MSRNIQSTRRGSCLCPPWPMPDEAITVAKILVTVVVILLQMTHHLSLYNRVALIRGVFSSVVTHEAHERVIKLANLFEMIEHPTNIVVNA